MIVKNYSDEATLELITLYLAEPTKETVDALSKKFDKPTKSIIGKLSKEGVYRRESYKTKTGESPVTKDEIVASICEYLEINPDALIGLEKAPKLALKRLENAVRNTP